MSQIVNKRIFYVNSRNRVSGTDSDFTCIIDGRMEDFDHVVVLQASIPKSYYLVQDGQNSFVLNEDGNQTTVAIPEGSYTRSSFRAQLETSLNNASFHGWLYSITVPSTTVTGDTGKFTYTVQNNGGIQPQFIIGTSLFEQMGFERNTTYTFVGNSLVSADVVKFQLEDTVFIHSNIASNGHDDILQEVFSSNAQDFGRIIWVCPDVEAYGKPINGNKSNSFRFYLTDEDGNPISLNGQNYVMTLMLYKKQTVYELIKRYIKLDLIK